MWLFIIVHCIIASHRFAADAAKCEVDGTFDTSAAQGSKCGCQAGFTGQACNIPIFHSQLTSRSPLANSTGSKRKRPSRRQHRKSKTASGMTTASTRLANDPCVPNPCLYGGSCVPRPTAEYTCMCHSGHDPNKKCIPCSRGRFGDDCNQVCVKCASINKCDPYIGCLQCAQGWRSTPTCDKVKCAQAGNDTCYPGKCVKKHNKCVCPLFWGGVDCKDTRTAELCNPQRIKCKGGVCYVDYEGKQVCKCPEGQQDVAGKCIRTCQDRSQSCRFGKCEGKDCKCEPGWAGLSCDNACDSLTYGDNCRGRCGFCKVLPCDRLTGSCMPEGCIPGFLPDNCHSLDPKKEKDEALFAYMSAYCTGDFNDDYNNPSSEAYQQASAYMGLVASSAAAALSSSVDIRSTSFSPGSIQVRLLLKFLNFSHLQNVNIQQELPKAVRKVYKSIPPPDGLELQPDSVAVLSVHRPAKPSSSSNDIPVSVKYYAVAVIFVATVAIAISLTYLWKRRMDRGKQYRIPQGTPENIHIHRLGNMKRSQAYFKKKSETL